MPDDAAATPADDEVLCIGCGYDVRGLAGDRSCPECGTSIARSQLGDRLAAADPVWLAKIRRGHALTSRGLRTCLWGVAAYFMLFFVVLAAFTLLSIANSPSVSAKALLDVIIAIVATVAGGCVLVGMLLATIGSFLVTIRDPRHSLSEAPLSPRRIARWSMLALLLTFASMQAAELMPAAGASTAFRVARLCILGGLVTTVLSALLRHLADLLARTAQTSLALECQGIEHRLRWLVPFMVLTLLPDVVMGGGRPGWTSAVGCVTLILALVLIVVAGQAANLMRRATREFDECLDRSRSLESAMAQE